RLDPRVFPAIFGRDGASPLDPAASRAAIARLAREMGAPSVEAAAEGFLAIAVEQMARAVDRISTERGFDPRDHVLTAFGGAAGQVACEVAEALGPSQVICPRYGSVLSAWGIGQAQLASLRQLGLDAVLDKAGLARAQAAAAEAEAAARAALAEQGADAGEVRLTLRLRYDGADAELPTPLGPLQATKAAFEAAHQRLFGFVEANLPIIIASVEAEAVSNNSSPAGGGDSPQGGETEGDLPSRQAPSVDHTADSSPSGGATGLETTPMFFHGAWHDAPVIRAEHLTQVQGPALIVRADTQIAVSPGWTATPGPDGMVRLEQAARRKAAALSLDRPDPITLELFNKRFMGVAEAMGAALERTAHSVNIKERLDFSCALFDVDGGLVANAPHMPVHLGSMGASVRAVRDRHPHLAPGDAFALNNPYAGGTHLPDITVVMPVFVGESAAPAFYVAARGHHADVGGVQPGSMPPFSRTLPEEGVLLDALPIMTGGAFLEAQVRTALAAGPWPARAPGRNIADLKAQIAACQAGAAAVAAMIETYGGAAVAAYMGFVQANAAASVRRAIGKLKDGQARVPMDGGGEIVVTTTVDAEAGEATLDFRASADQLASNFNAPSAIVDAAALYVFRTLVDDDIPLNAGCLEPLRILTREGSMLAPRPPAAVVAGNVETSQHVVDALYAALGVMANAQGSMNNFTFGDEARQYYETLCGGAGATARAPGTSAVHTHMTNSRLTDPEILERRFPVRVEAFEIRRGSGGAGAMPGGDGARRRIAFLAPMDAALLSTRRDHAPQGIAGGGPGLPGAQRLIGAGGAVKELPGCFSLKVAPGDVIEIETPGGGGFGPA
ncbi:hydantoinase B/oxoprolinase family protein, partial [Phenylobacterium sp.]|uniref:hydantoinase B/oxoprolinase family protein n=1 Tax=Phenylobacterium sp. TaxID=1871053 RepID=UPI0035AF5E83